MPTEQLMTVDELRQLLRTWAKYADLAAHLEKWERDCTSPDVELALKSANEALELEAKLASVDKIIFLAKRKEEKD